MQTFRQMPSIQVIKENDILLLPLMLTWRIMTTNVTTNIAHLLCTNNHAKHFHLLYHLILSRTFQEEYCYYYCHFYSWRNWVTVREINLLRDIHLVYDSTGTLTKQIVCHYALLIRARTMPSWNQRNKV